MEGILMTALRDNATRRWARLLAAPFALAGLLTAAAPEAAQATAAAAAPCVSMTGVPISSPSTEGSILTGLAVRSPCDAWAVGQLLSEGHGLSLMMHWDGARWTQAPSQSPGDTQNWLFAVAATRPPVPGRSGSRDTRPGPSSSAGRN
jgi:hypothetical protein